MRALLEFIAKYYHWMIFVALEGISLWLLFQFNRYQHSLWLTAVTETVSRAHEAEVKALRYLTLGTVNEQLTRRNNILEYNLAEALREIEILSHDSTGTERLQADRMDGIELISAKVVTNSVMRRDNLITINAGIADGVREEMGVVCGTGLVGIVLLSSEHFSIVLPLLNSRSHISCRLRGSDFFGHLTWDGVNPLYAQLDDIPRHARFNIGDIVETSGFSSVFPSGIFVGKVEAIGNSDDGLSYKLRVHLATDFATLQDVCVIAQQFQPEVRELEHQADSLMRQ
ncbi:MAG: rod shape-determining protein MreC [Bacteroidaceae bacterium]|nr:rod shape-determining protein MreC [Bacteroidaceae bacterium]